MDRENQEAEIRRCDIRQPARLEMAERLQDRKGTFSSPKKIQWHQNTQAAERRQKNIQLGAEERGKNH